VEVVKTPPQEAFPIWRNLVVVIQRKPDKYRESKKVPGIVIIPGTFHRINKLFQDIPIGRVFLEFCSGERAQRKNLYAFFPGFFDELLNHLIADSLSFIRRVHFRMISDP
jgi:hypothetical protein